MAEAKKKTETIRLFSDGGKYKGDLFVSVNGVNYQCSAARILRCPRRWRRSSATARNRTTRPLPAWKSWRIRRNFNPLSAQSGMAGAA